MITWHNQKDMLNRKSGKIRQIHQNKSDKCQQTHQGEQNFQMFINIKIQSGLKIVVGINFLEY